MTVRLYTSLDTGAPVLSGNQFARVRQILLACLVTGYGSKPAAGWTVGHDVAGGFSLFNGFGYINFVENSATYAHTVYIMEAITNGSTALAAGVNRRSCGWYDGSSSTERQGFYTGSTGLNAAAAQNPYWSVVADDKTCIFLFGGGATSADSAGGSSIHYFGQTINAAELPGVSAFVSLGGYLNDGNTSSGFFAVAGRYGMSLRNPFTGLVAQGDGARYGAGIAVHWRGVQSSSLANKTQISRLQPVRAILSCYGTVLNGSTVSSTACCAGYLRGLICEPTLCNVPLSQTMTLLGLANTWQARVTPITLPNGKQWLPLFASSGDWGGFVSLDPADWE
ncbi:hypothetical protein [Pseudomonas nitroreducens]|uniref:hypothetical protein n=1 Tax=Pseudomonas nitroreducens TaxID=46680 RepID=UPI002D80A6E1|nr:hypothetical protein [Pseudomonas nitroreducens]